MRRKLLTTAQEIVIYRGNCCLHRKLLFVQEIIIYTGNNHHVGNYYLHRKSLSRGKLLFAQKTIITRAENSYLRENYYLYRNYYYVRRKCSGETRQRKLLFPKGILLYIGNTPGETRQRKLLFTQEIIIYIGNTAPHRDTPERRGRFRGVQFGLVQEVFREVFRVQGLGFRRCFERCSVWSSLGGVWFSSSLVQLLNCTSSRYSGETRSILLRRILSAKTICQISLVQFSLVQFTLLYFS